MAIALLVLVILLAAFLASPLFERVLRTRVLAAASERFERSLTLRKARASLVPLVVRVEDFTLQGLGDDPILRADRIALRVRVWPTLRTLGRTIALAVVRVEGGEANLMRLPDGSWDLPTLPYVPPEERRTYLVDEATVEKMVARVVDPARGLRMEAQNVSLDASLQEDALAIRKLRAEIAGGVVQAVARARTGGAAPGMAADVEISRLDLGRVPPLAGLLSGVLYATVRLSGEGVGREALANSLVGSGEMRLEDGRWHDLSLLEKLTAEIAEFIYLPRGAAPESDEAIDLGSPIEAAARLEKGWVRITRPPEIRAAFGATEVNGRMSLDERLDLLLDIGLSSEFLSTISGGLVEPDEPIPVKMRVTGTTDEPEFELTDTEALEAQNPTFFRRLLRAIRNALPGGD